VTTSHERYTAKLWGCARKPHVLTRVALRPMLRRFEVIGANWTADRVQIALSGREQFELDIRIGESLSSFIMLHESNRAYQRQRVSRFEATQLARVLFNLYFATRALYCVFPTSEAPGVDWDAVEFAIFPVTEIPETVPGKYRFAKLRPRGCAFMSLPVKRFPGEEIPGSMP
jgi:hypothetical protein